MTNSLQLAKHYATVGWLTRAELSAADAKFVMNDRAAALSGLERLLPLLLSARMNQSNGQIIAGLRGFECTAGESRGFS
jgi:hypothetical protein